MLAFSTDTFSDVTLMLQISSQTVGLVLDLVLKKEGFSNKPAHGKKKKKSTIHLNSAQNNDATLRCGSVVSFLSSLLDIMQLKKDIENRYVKKLTPGQLIN